ncbi:MAG: hypothetical protein PWP51_1400 [Clostridiales bacterium]|nr:hypothetical protein [Clostridiales bacterium]MDN5298847.1 hypothetical protein [Clostridiales bacterium]
MAILPFFFITAIIIIVLIAVIVLALFLKKAPTHSKTIYLNGLTEMEIDEVKRYVDAIRQRHV